MGGTHWNRWLDSWVAPNWERGGAGMMGGTIWERGGCARGGWHRLEAEPGGGDIWVAPIGSGAVWGKVGGTEWSWLVRG